jgi:hypothetical protein
MGCKPNFLYNTGIRRSLKVLLIFEGKIVYFGGVNSFYPIFHKMHEKAHFSLVLKFVS